MPAPLRTFPLTCFLAISVFACLTVSAQSSSQTDILRERRERERVDMEVESRRSALRNLKRTPDDRNKNEDKPVKLSAAQKKQLEPSPAQRAAFAAFLKQPDTGMVRLLPREKFDNTIHMPIRGGGAFYSFTETSHQAGPLSEILFQDGRFRVAFSGLSFGLMTSLGDTPLEQITTEHQAVKYLHGLTPPVDYQDLRLEADKNLEGFKVGDSLYRTILPAKLDSTYVLRSVIHDEADTIIAFRVVGMEADGGVTLLWKRLYKLKSKKFKNVPKETRQRVEWL